MPASTLYVAARIEHDDRTREIIRLASIHGLNLMEADRLEMDRIAAPQPSGRGDEGAAVPVFLARRAGGTRGQKSRAMEAAQLRNTRAARPLFIALDGVTDPQNLGAVIRSRSPHSAPTA